MRLASGGRVDRATPISFTFDGRPVSGLAGDTIASALLANDIHLVGRSFKYHRPRGILGAGSEEPNALVEIRQGSGRFDPNTRATVAPLIDGLSVTSQNRWPSLVFDLGAVNDRLSPLIPTGFYYKTFMWPPKAWARVYEPRIRRAAGLGRAPTEPDPDRYAQLWAHCDLLVVGAGPAGLAAAMAAQQDGRSVILCDEGEEFGGSLLARPDAVIDSMPAWQWLKQSIEDLSVQTNVTLLPRATAFAHGADNLVSIAERLSEPFGPRERLWLVRVKQVVLAAGAIERPVVFPGNDRPGIMLASAVESYINRYAVLPGTRIVACVDHDSGYRAALAARSAGAEVTIADMRPSADDGLINNARAAGIEVLQAHAPVGTRGRRRVSSITLDGPSRRTLPCNLVMMAGGWTPSLHLHSQARGSVCWDESSQSFLPGEIEQNVQSVGGCRGIGALGDAFADGWSAGAADKGLACPAIEPEPKPAPTPIVARPAAAGKAFVDFQNDVTQKDVRLAVREGFHSIEHIKRYTTSGMATDQGRTSNINALAIASAALDRPVPQIGLTTFRSPYTPTTFGTLAAFNRATLFEPERRTPSHDWAAANGAVFEDVGQWKRARYFPRGSERMREAVVRECLVTRSIAGIFDASTLGKIEVVGPDAAEFLNRLYVNSFTKLAVGRCRYGIMLREDGFILDDGVIGRIAADRFHVTTTTGGAAAVLHQMEDFRQTEFPELRVWLTSTTEQWATIAVQGPKAREIVAPLIDSADLSAKGLPHMSVRECRIAGHPGRLFRISFTGESGFELNVPSANGGEVWEAVIAAGSEFGAVPYGTETMHVLRAEKGYIIIGQETDGTVTVDDAGLSWAIGKTKADFVGKRSLGRPALIDPDRKQMVGLLSADRQTILEEGAQVVDPGEPLRSLGHVTSSYWSATLGRPIALALVRAGRKRLGETLCVPMPDRPVPVTVADSVFHDREGALLHG